MKKFSVNGAMGLWAATKLIMALILLSASGPSSTQTRSDAFYAETKPAPLIVSLIHKQGVRTLQVIVDGKTLNNTKIIACEDCGGIMGDAFMLAEVEGESLTVLFYSGSGYWKWTEKLVFKLNDRRQLILASIRLTYFNVVSPADAEVALKKPKGLVRFEDYDPEKEYSYHVSDLGKRYK